MATVILAVGVGLWVNFLLPWWAGAAIGIPIALVFFRYSIDDISGVLSPTPAGALEISQWGSYEGAIRDSLLSPSLDPSQPDAMLPYAVALNQARQWVNDIKALPPWFLPDGPREQTRPGLCAAYRGFIGADSWDLDGGPKKESMAPQRAVGGGVTLAAAKSPHPLPDRPPRRGVSPLVPGQTGNVRRVYWQQSMLLLEEELCWVRCGVHGFGEVRGSAILAGEGSATEDDLVGQEFGPGDHPGPYSAQDR